jgi:hypothetical protein
MATVCEPLSRPHRSKQISKPGLQRYWVAQHFGFGPICLAMCRKNFSKRRFRSTLSLEIAQTRWQRRSFFLIAEPQVIADSNLGMAV